MKIIDMSCPKCGAPLKTDLKNEKAVCEYCGYYALIEQEDTLDEIRAKAQSKSYGYHKGKLQAEAEADKREKRNSIKVKVIVIGIIGLIAMVSMTVQNLSMPRVNPFDCIEVSFRGNDGKGEVVIDSVYTNENIDPNYIDFAISKENNLAQGDIITIQATSEEYRLTEKIKTYRVEGLDEYLKELENIPEEALEIIHTKAESVLDINLDSSKNVGAFVDMKPVKLFLVTDGKQTNELYDVFEVHFMTGEGEKTYYVAACFDDVIVRNGQQASINMSYGMYYGNLTQVEGSLWIMGYNSVEEIRADILSSQDSYMELKELDL